MGQTWSAGFDTSGVVGGANAARDALRGMREEAERASAGLGGSEKASGGAGGGAKRQKKETDEAARAAREKAAADKAAARAAADQAKRASAEEKAAAKEKAAADKAAGREASTEAKKKIAEEKAAAKEKKDADKAASAETKAKNKALADSDKASKKKAADEAKTEKKAEADKKKAAADAKAKKKDDDAKADALKAGALRAVGAAGLVAAVGLGLASKAYGSVLDLASKATGIGSFDELTQLAIGARSAAQLQAIGIRTNLSFRRMFLGIDSTPLVRAQERFSRNFTEQSVTGRALGDILTRAYSGAFAMVERLEPAATGAFQGMVLGALMVENAWLRLRIATFPIVDPILKAVSATDLLNTAASVAAMPFAELARDVVVIQAGVEAAAKAWSALKGSGIVDGAADLVVPEGVGGISKLYDMATSSEASKSAGGAMGDGVAGGLDGKSGDLYEAGKRAAKSALKGVKDEAEIKSPARRFRREGGRQMGAGIIGGMEDMEGPIQRAAERSLVPDPTGLALGGRGGGGGGAQFTGPLVSIGQLVVNGTDELRELVMDIIEGSAARAAATLGLRVPARS